MDWAILWEQVRKYISKCISAVRFLINKLGTWSQSKIVDRQWFASHSLLERTLVMWLVLYISWFLGNIDVYGLWRKSERLFGHASVDMNTFVSPCILPKLLQDGALPVSDFSCFAVELWIALIVITCCMLLVFRLWENRCSLELWD